MQQELEEQQRMAEICMNWQSFSIRYASPLMLMLV